MNSALRRVSEGDQVKQAQKKNMDGDGGQYSESGRQRENVGESKASFDVCWLIRPAV